MQSQFDADIFVAGGGPAGLAAAIATARKGFRVVLADGRKPPFDKACGEALLPDSLAAVRNLGISVPLEGSSAIRGIGFVNDNDRCQSQFPNGCGRGVRRTVLHDLLAAEAERSGVELRWGSSVTGMDGHEVSLTSGRIRARWIVGADGAMSRVRSLASLNAGVTLRTRYGFRRHYAIRPWSEFVEVHWHRGMQVYATPVAPDQVCVAVVSRDPHMRLDRALTYFPELRSRLWGAGVSSQERGAATISRRLHRVRNDTVFLVGDASGSVDAVTGMGMGLAFQQSLALAEVLASETPAMYQAAHRRFMRRPAFMGELLLAMDRWPGIADRAIRAFSNHPELFRSLLAFHAGDVDPMRQVLTHAELGWRLLTG